jgi:hypothetical protein
MSSNELAKIQRMLLSSIRRRNLSDLLQREIKESPLLTAGERLKIYQDAYSIRIKESITEDFPLTENYLGSAKFMELVDQFIIQNSSRVPDLSEYSQNFLYFIHLYQPEAYEAGARDWLLTLVQSSPEPIKTLSPQQIQNGAAFHIRKHPAVHWHRLGAGFLICFQNNDEILFRQVDPVEMRILEFLETPRTAEQLEAYLETHNLPPTETAQKISNWLSSSILFCEEA